jgi:hypothetical protein
MATPTSLPATFVAGDVLTAAQMNNLRGAFRVLQVVSATTSTSASNSTSTYADTNLTASITPSSTTSQILVCVSQGGLLKQTNNTAMVLQLLRGATVIQKFARWGNTDSTLTQSGNATTLYLDSPATTSSTTYKTQFNSTNNSASVTVQWDSVVSTIILMEISA